MKFGFDGIISVPKALEFEWKGWKRKGRLGKRRELSEIRGWKEPQERKSGVATSFLAKTS